MYHLVDNLQSRTGDGLANYYVKLKDEDGNYATLYADANLTPISSESGVADAAKTDANGMYRCYVADGDYVREFYADAALTALVVSVPITSMFTPGGILDRLADTSEGEGAALVVMEDGTDLETAVSARVKTADLASTASGKGAAMVGVGLEHAPGIVHTAKDWLERGVRVSDWMTAAVLADAKAARAARTAPANDHGALIDAAWSAVQEIGGELVFPALHYGISSTRVFERTLDMPFNIALRGWGARIYAGGAPAMFRLTGKFNEYPTLVEGFTFDLRGDEDCEVVFDLAGTNRVTLRHNSLEFWHDPVAKPLLDFIRLRSSRPGEGITTDDFNCFWTCIEHNAVRKRSGSESGLVSNFIKMIGAANATDISKNCLQHSKTGVLLLPEPSTTTKVMPNGAVITRNWFEGITEYGVRFEPPEAPAYISTGTRITSNRFEACPTAVSFKDTGGAAPAIHSTPTLLADNYYTVGSVTTVVDNPQGIEVTVRETASPGYAGTLSINNRTFLSGDSDIRFAEGKHFRLGGVNGSLNWDRARLKWGTYNFWIDPTTGKVMLKSSDPSGASDGTVVGTQA